MLNIRRKKLPRKKFCTPRQLNFITEYARNGMDVVAAYQKAFTSKNSDVAYTEGMRLLKLPWIETELKKHKSTLERRAARLGMHDEALLKQHKLLIFARKRIPIKVKDASGNETIEWEEQDDLAMIKQGLELIYKLLGKNAAERHAFEGAQGKPLFPTSDLTDLDAKSLVDKRDALLKVLQGIET